MGVMSTEAIPHKEGRIFKDSVFRIAECAQARKRLGQALDGCELKF
jgi:hypothetical protein